jgi:hypothetical protein
MALPGGSPHPFDVDRLNREERALWDEHFAAGTDSLLIRVWSFGYWCMLALDGVPAVVSEWLPREHGAPPSERGGGPAGDDVRWPRGLDLRPLPCSDRHDRGIESLR